jgi:hypothetical protein
MGRPRTWTDDDLRTALRDSTSIAEVVRRLRLSHGGAAFTTVRTRMEQLGLDLGCGGSSATPAPAASGRDGNEPLPRSVRRWSDHDLAVAVGRSGSLHQVFKALGLTVGGSQWLVVRARIRHLRLDTSHWRHPLIARSSQQLMTVRERLQRADLAALIDRCDTRAELLRSLDILPTSSSYLALRNALSEAGIEPMAIGGRTGGGTTGAPLDELTVANSPLTNTARLRHRLIAEGVKAARCEGCGLVRWNGEPAPLQLDHIDGDRTNNVLGNLRILCANCHAMTPTWGGRNRGRPNRSQSTS